MTNRSAAPDGPAPSRGHVIGRYGLVLGAAVFGVFHLMLTMGAASFVHECEAFVCAQLQQAIFAALAAVALFVTAYRISNGRPAAWIALLGTLPILVVHVLLVVSDPNESIFFPLSSVPVPAISAAAILFGAVRRSRRPLTRA